MTPTIERKLMISINIKTRNVVFTHTHTEGVRRGGITIIIGMTNHVNSPFIYRMFKKKSFFSECSVFCHLAKVQNASTGMLSTAQSHYDENFENL